MIRPENVSLPVDELPGESVITLFFDDQKPLDGPAAVMDWRLDGLLTNMLLDGSLLGRAGESVVLQNNGKFNADWALFVGGGKWQGLSAETHASLIRHMFSVAEQAGFRNISIALSSHPEFDAEVIKTQIEELIKTETGSLESCLYTCDVALSV